MKKAALLLSAFTLLHLISYSQMSMVEIAGKQTITFECAHSFEGEPLRTVPVVFSLKGKPAGKNPVVKVKLKTGPGQLVSDPTIQQPDVTFKVSDFPGTVTTANQVPVQVMVRLSKTPLQISEKFWIWIEGQEKGGTVEVTVSCTNTGQNRADTPAKKPAETPPSQVATDSKLTVATAPTGATTINPNVPLPSTPAIASATPVTPVTTATAPATSKPPCSCISIKGGAESFIKPLISTAATGTEHEDRPVSFKIKLDSGCRVPNSDTTIKIKLVAINPSNSKPELLTAYYPVKNSDWPTAKTAKELSFTTFIRVNNIDSLGDDKLSYLVLDGCTDDADKRQVIRESSKTLFNPNKPFWVEAGYNFDLLDDIKTNNIFYGVFMYKRDIRRIFLKPQKFNVNLKTGATDTITRQPNLSLFGGFYNSKSISEEMSDQFSPLVYFDPNRSLRPIDPIQPNVFKAYADSGQVKVTSSVRNVGLFISPQVRLTHGNANNDGLHLFASLWIEMIWQRFNTSYDFTGMKRYDSFAVRFGSDSFAAVTPRPVNTSDDVRSHYFGVGFPLYLKDKDVNLYFSPIIGITNQKLAVRDNVAQLLPFRNPFRPITAPLGESAYTKTIRSVLDSPKPHNWHPFYLFQFRLNEERFGFAFTGEVRGLLKDDYKPIISLAISKKFDLDKLLTFGLAK